MGILDRLAFAFRRRPALPAGFTKVDGQPTQLTMRSDGALYSAASGFGTNRDPASWVMVKTDRPVLSKAEIDALVRFEWGCKRHVQLLPQEALRKWITLKLEGGPEDGAKQVLDRLEELRAQQELRQLCIWERQYGGAVLLPILNTGSKIDTPLPRDESGRIKPGSVFELREIKALSRHKFMEPNGLEVQNDPKKPGYGRPEFWLPILDPLNPMSGQQTWKIHASRLYIMWGYFPVEPDLLSEFGESVLDAFADPWKAYASAKAHAIGIGQRMNETRLKVGGLRKLLSTPESRSLFSAFAEEMASMRSALKLFLVDREDEITDANLTVNGMQQIIEMSQTDVAGASGLSARRFFGLAHEGMSDNDETGAQIDDGEIVQYQTDTVLGPLNFLIELVLAELSVKNEAFRSVTSWQATFRPLREETASDKATRRKTEAEVDAILYGVQAIDGEQIRGRLKNDPENVYDFEEEDDLDLDDVAGKVEVLTEEQIAEEEANAPPPPPTMSREELQNLMPEPEVREMLNIGVVGIKNLIKAGKLQAYLIGGRRKFAPRAVHELLANSTIQPTPPDAS